MVGSPDTVGVVYQHIWRGLAWGAVPHLFEARCAWSITDPNSMFVLASEGATYDAGLVIDNDADLPERMTERLFHVLKKYQNRAAILPVDCKTCLPELTPNRGPMMRYTIGLSSSQRRECAIILLQNPAAPHLVSVCPVSYLTRSHGPVGFVGWPEMPITAYYTEPFPPELSPTVMPIQFLDASMQAARNFFLNPSGGFVNPYTNVTLEGISPWKTVDASTLLPSDTSHLQDIKIVHLAWVALQSSSSRYDVERMMIQPSVGDFLILDHDTESRVTVEVKQNMAVVSETGHLKVYMADRHGSKKSSTRTFSVFTKPDFYLLTMEQDTKAIFAPSSFFPDRWSYEQVVPGGCYHWDPPLDGLAVHVVQLDEGPPTLGSGLTKILDRYNSTQGLLRAVQLPFESEHFTGCHSLLVQGGRDLTETDIHVDDEDAEYIQPLQTITPGQPPRRLRGASGRWSRKAFNAHEEYWLRQQCSRENFGALYYLGRHPSGTYAFAPGSWHNRDPIPFNELSPNTEMLFINFAPTSCLDTANFHDVRRPMCYFHATHGTTPSIFILSVHHTVPESQGHVRFIVPSQLLADDLARRQLNETVVSKGWKALTATTYLRLRLSTGEPIDVFAVREDEVVKVLKKLYSRLAGSLDPTLAGVLDLHSTVGVDPELYTVTRREVLRQFIPVLLKQSFLDKIAEPEEDD